MIEIVGEIAGRQIREATLVSDTGVTLRIMDWGAVVREWQVPVAGAMRGVVLGLANAADYPEHSPHLGAIAGRVANRIRGGRFRLGDKVHQLRTDATGLHLHGGPGGFGCRFWDMETDGDGVTLHLVSPDGDAGYPGQLAVRVSYRLAGNRVMIGFEAEADAPTPVNLVQHHYFNLMGHGDILDHTLTIPADTFTETDDDLLATGAFVPVAGGPLDFRDGRGFRDGVGGPVAVDSNLVLHGNRDRSAPAAMLVAPDRSLTLRLWTDRPGVQVYNSGTLNVSAAGLEGRPLGPFAGLCLEDQDLPDAVNHPQFPSIIVQPDKPYRRTCIIEIA